MPYRCLVWTCKSKGDVPGISYHSLGKHRYATWLNAIGRSPDENLSPKNVICSNHFHIEDFKFVNGKSILKSDAVPTSNLPRNSVLREVTCLDNVDSEPPPENKKTHMCTGQNTKAVISSTAGPSEDRGLPKLLDNVNLKDLSSSDSLELRGSPKRNKRLIKKIHTYATTTEQIQDKLRNEKEKNKILRNKYRVEKQKTKRLRKKVFHLKHIVIALRKKELLKVDACAVLEKTFSGIPLAIMRFDE